LARCVRTLNIPENLDIPPSWTPDVATLRLSAILKSTTNLNHASVVYDAFSRWYAPSEQRAIEAVVETLNEVGLKSLNINVTPDGTGTIFPVEWTMFRGLHQAQLTGHSLRRSRFRGSVSSVRPLDIY
jgi:hypothetical protein